MIKTLLILLGVIIILSIITVISVNIFIANLSSYIVAAVKDSMEDKNAS